MSSGIIYTQLLKQIDLSDFSMPLHLQMDEVRTGSSATNN
jgi:hypothetical protein